MKFIYKLFFVFATMLISSNIAQAETSSGYAWSENTGYVEFSGVTVESDYLSGYAYSPNIGWISLNCINTNSCSTTDYGVVNSSGNLSGYAWSENTGYIDFDKVLIDTSSGVFSGYAYGPNIGWISLNCDNTSTCDTVDYKVTTEWSETVNGSVAIGGYPSKAKTKVTSNTPTVESLEAIILELTNKISLLKGINPPKNYLLIYNDFFYNDLKFGQIHPDVKRLQKFLNENGFMVSAQGPGSSGNETDKFGSLTQSALIKFQVQFDINPAIGFFGPITRGFINND